MAVALILPLVIESFGRFLWVMNILEFRGLGSEKTVQGLLHWGEGSIWSLRACTHIHPYGQLLDCSIKCPCAGEALQVLSLLAVPDYSSETLLFSLLLELLE